jgi:hypothetical protein
MRSRLPRRGCLAATAALSLLAFVPPAHAALDEVNTKRLRDAVTVNGLLQHERALQSIANLNGGTRASGTAGYEASVNYVTRRLERAGYRVTRQEFTFPFFRDLAAPVLQQVSPTAATYETATYQYSGSGEVTGRLVPVRDIVIPPPATGNSTAGCEASDFDPADATEPQVALIQRGTCTFEVKAANAQAAGYDAVIIFNEGQEGRQELQTQATLGRPFTIPVVAASFATGQALYDAARAAPRSCAWRRRPRPTSRRRRGTCWRTPRAATPSRPWWSAPIWTPSWPVPASMTTGPARRRCSSSPRSSASWRSSRGARSASRSGARRSPACSARSTTSRRSAPTAMNGP